MREENGAMDRGERRENDVFRIVPPLCGVPVITFILMLLFSAGAAVLACDGPYEGWLWLVISAGLAAYADFISGSRLTLLAPIVGAAISAVLFYPCVPLWTLAAAPIGYFISAAARGRIGRNMSIILSSAAVIIFAALHFAALSALSGELSINGMIAQAVAPYSRAKEIILQNKELLIKNGITEDPTELLSHMRNVLLRAAPSTVCVCALMISWLSSAVMNTLSRFFTPHAFICGKKTVMSVSSAVVFVAAYLIVLLFGSNDSSVIVLAAENLSTMLMPGFFVVGISELAAALKARIGGISLGFYIAAVVITMLMSMGGVAVLYAAYGVFHTMRVRYLEIIAERGDEL